MTSSQDPEMSLGTRLGSIIDNGFLCLSIAVGNELNLFEELAKGSQDNGMNSTMIAESLQLKERYVREWLGAVVTAGLVDKCAQEGMFFLSPEKARHLSSAQSMWANLMAIVAGAYHDVASAFKIGGPNGVPYSKYLQFHEWRHKYTSLEFPNFVEKYLIPACPQIWEKAKDDGISVCEIGCSEGVLTSILAEQFPKCHFWASDISESAIQNANKLKVEKGLNNVTYDVQDVSALPEEWTSKFDLVLVYDVIHDIGRPDLGVREIHRVIKDGGMACIVDVNCHTKLEDNSNDGSIIYSISLFHCMPVSLNEPGGWGLGAAWGIERAEQLFLECGFSGVEIKSVGVQNALFLLKK